VAGHASDRARRKSNSTWWAWLQRRIHANGSGPTNARISLLAPAAGTMFPVPPVTSPLPPATPTTVTATHVTMRADHHRLRRLRYAGRYAPADRCTAGDSNGGAGQDICQEVAATDCSHCLYSLVRLRVRAPQKYLRSANPTAGRRQEQVRRCCAAPSRVTNSTAPLCRSNNAVLFGAGSFAGNQRWSKALNSQ
jgi:hypothetical protein